MAPKPELVPPADPEGDDVLKILKGLADDAKAAHATFVKKLASGALADPAALAIEVGEIFSIQADLAQYAFQAHYEHFDWASEVDSDLDDIKEQLGAGSTLLPEDALKLKTAILSLVQNLRSPDDDITLAVKKQADDAIAFIDEVTAEDEGDDEETETEDEE